MFRLVKLLFVLVVTQQLHSTNAKFEFKDFPHDKIIGSASTVTHGATHFDLKTRLNVFDTTHSRTYGTHSSANKQISIVVEAFDPLYLAGLKKEYQTKSLLGNQYKAIQDIASKGYEYNGQNHTVHVKVEPFVAKAQLNKDKTDHTQHECNYMPLVDMEDYETLEERLKDETKRTAIVKPENFYHLMEQVTTDFVFLMEHTKRTHGDMSVKNVAFKKATAGSKDSKDSKDPIFINYLYSTRFDDPDRQKIYNDEHEKNDGTYVIYPNGWKGMLSENALKGKLRTKKDEYEALARFWWFVLEKQVPYDKIRSPTGSQTDEPRSKWFNEPDKYHSDADELITLRKQFEDKDMIKLTDLLNHDKIEPNLVKYMKIVKDHPEDEIGTRLLAFCKDLKNPTPPATPATPAKK